MALTQRQVEQLQKRLTELVADTEPPPYAPPIEFIEHAYNLRLDPWQREYVEQATLRNRIAIAASRQSGKSQATAGFVAWFATYMPRVMVLVGSRSLRQASYFLDRVAAAVGTVIPRKSWLISNRLSFVLPNGSSVVSIPAVNADTARGFSPNLIILDEAAFAPLDLISVITPSLAATGGQLTLISSCNGRQGFFFDAFEGQTSDLYWSRCVTWEECPRIDPDFIRGEQLILGDIRFRSEYCAEFLSPEGAFFGFQGMQALFDESHPDGIVLPSSVEDYDPADELDLFGQMITSPTKDDMRVAFDTADRLQKLLYD